MEDKDDDDKRELVLIYGTLKRGQPSHEIVNDESSGKSRFVGKAQTLAKWPLVIASKYNIPFLLLKEGTGNRIWGEIYEVDSTKLKFLDHFEGCPTYYERLPIDVELHEEDKEPRQTKAFAYMLREFKPSLLDREMFVSYDSYGSHGLPFVTRLRKRTTSEEVDAVLDQIKDGIDN